MKKVYTLTLALFALIGLSSNALANGGATPLQFVTHLQAGLSEQEKRVT
jgi:hypothetical protein